MTDDANETVAQRLYERNGGVWADACPDAKFLYCFSADQDITRGRHFGLTPADLAGLADGSRVVVPATTAAADVLAERRRQAEAEGWSAEHDDEHTDGSIAQAAITYATGATIAPVERSVMDEFGRKGTPYAVHSLWPSTWAAEWFKPTNRRRDLVKAGALILAEIERLDRAAARPGAKGGDHD